MLLLTLWMFVGVTGWTGVSCSVTCPDGKICPDLSTCCHTSHGYGCCLYPNAVCCSDGRHCCPSGYSCNSAAQVCQKEDKSWMNVPMLKNLAAEEPPVSPLENLDNNLIPDPSEGAKSSSVRCDYYFVCPDGTTCCKHITGGWYCCPYSPGRCCHDGNHCCPYGFDCDYTFTHCVRKNVRYPFIVNQVPLSIPASRISAVENAGTTREMAMTPLTESSEVGVIRCDSQFYCAVGASCCKGSTGQWNCCPYPLGQCCKDGKHCCQYGFTCDPSSMTCQKGYIQVPFETKPAKQD